MSVNELNAIVQSADHQSMFMSADRAPDISSTIFNTKKDYDKDNGSLFLQDEPGLFDSINRRHQRIWNLYKKLKSQDWDENEFNYAECIPEFVADTTGFSTPLVRSISWQWESDSLAAHNIIPLYAPFISSSELTAAIIEVGRNEVLHALTYSEIVKYSFPNPKEVMEQVLADQEPLRRLEAVAKVMAEVKEVGCRLTSRQLSRDSNEARDAVMLLVFTMFGLERLQFTPSFTVTFAYGEMDSYIPIIKSVQKICNDEFSIHVELGREMIRNELKTKVGRESWERIKDRLIQIYTEIAKSELKWTREYVFKGVKELPGCTIEMIEQFIYYSALDVFTEAELPYPAEFPIVTTNPIDYMADYVDVNLNQASPQEEKTGNYMLGGFSADAGNTVFDDSGL